MKKQPSPAARKAKSQSDHLRLDLPNYVPYRISIVAALVRRSLSDIYRHHPGLTEPEWKVMTTLAHYGPLLSGDIGLYVTLDRAAVSRSLARLIEKGLASRTESKRDQRMFLVDLTPEAAEMYDDMARHALEIESRILETLEPDDIRQLLLLLDKVESCFRGYADRRRTSLISTAREFSESHADRGTNPGEDPSKRRRNGRTSASRKTSIPRKA